MKSNKKKLSQVVGKHRKIKKLTDEEFLSILRENGGKFSLTARAIQKQFNIQYSRQAVRIRANKFAEILEDIYEESLDIAEDGLNTLMQVDFDKLNLSDEYQRLDAKERIRAALDLLKIKKEIIEYKLNTQGKIRGYTTKTELDLGESRTIKFMMDGE